MRQQIVDYIEEKMKDLTFSDGTKVFKFVAQTFVPVEALQDFQMPCCFILTGRETRDYSGSRVICNFDVLLRVVVRSDRHLTAELNKVLDPVLKYFVEDKFIGGNSIFPVQIVQIEPSEGWLSPIELADITVRTFYSYACV